ncbi:MAG: Uma2 family endonuclease [Verrucomicrobiales bacterium]|jgi:Uma2 family endonuclease
MNAALDIRKDEFISFEDYLVGEEEAEERHEYCNGDVEMMAGASDNHELVAGNIFAAIHGHFRGKGCRVYKGDMKLRFKTPLVDLGYYPDLMVVCDPKDDQTHYKERPKLIIEVMSRMQSDLAEKLFIYQQIESVEEYLVLDQSPEEPKAWLYGRGQEWKIKAPITGGSIDLASIDFSFDLADLYVA